MGKRRYGWSYVDDKKKKYIELVDKYANMLADIISVTCPHSREKSLALTKLDEAVFWAEKSIADCNKEE